MSGLRICSEADSPFVFLGELPVPFLFLNFCWDVFYYLSVYLYFCLLNKLTLCSLCRKYFSPICHLPFGIVSANFHIGFLETIRPLFIKVWGKVIRSVFVKCTTRTGVSSARFSTSQFWPASGFDSWLSKRIILLGIHSFIQLTAFSPREPCVGPWETEILALK